MNGEFTRREAGGVERQVKAGDNFGDVVSESALSFFNINLP
jgi:hypothetical protein